MKTFEEIKQLTLKKEMLPHAAGIITSSLQYSSISTYEAYLTGLMSQEQILGLTHYDLPCPMSQSAPELQRQYQKIITTKKSLKVLNIHTSAQGDLGIYLTDKIPHFNAENDVDEIAYYCHEKPLSQFNNLVLSCMHTLKHINHKKLAVSVTYELINKYEDLNLSTRESEVYYYLMRGHSAKSIANILMISSRTVDTHIENIKSKLDCPNRQILIEYAYFLNLLYYIPALLLDKIILIAS